MIHSRSTKIIVLLISAFMLMACSLFTVEPTPVPTLTPETLEEKTSAATPTPFPTNTPNPPTETPASPTSVPTRVPPTRNPNSTLTFDSGLNAYRVEFGAGGTWAQFDGQLNNSNQSVRYVLSAMQGQQMGVSIVESVPFSIDVSHAGNSISNTEIEQPFWRGTLPETGDYIITVRTQIPGSYTLRITINPPGDANQYFDYQHSLFTLRYSDEFSPTSYTPVGEFKGTPNLVLIFINSDFYRPATNLGEAYFMVNTLNDLATCTQVTAPGETLLGEKTFNGNKFTESKFIGAGAGNIYDQLFYRAVLNNTCYEITFFMHYGNIGNYAPGTVVEFDRDALLQKFEAVLSTFAIN